MALQDWLWLVRLIMEILKLIAQLPQDELDAIASLRTSPLLGDPPAKPTRNKKTATT